MARIPYRHVEALATDPRINELRSVTALRDRLATLDRLLSAPADPRVLAAALEEVVRAVAANRKALLPHRAVAPRLAVTVKDPWSTSVPAMVERGLIAELSRSKTVSVRTDPRLRMTPMSDGRLGRPRLKDGELTFVHGRRVTARVTGPNDRLALVERVTTGLARPLVVDLALVPLPKDLVDSAST